MVNNYVKNSIVDPPVKKHYTSKHLAYLMVVCILKRCYTLSEIANLIDIQAKIPGSNYKAAYDKFSTYFEIYLHEVMKKGNLDDIEKLMNLLGETESAEAYNVMKDDPLTASIKEEFKDGLF